MIKENTRQGGGECCFSWTPINGHKNDNSADTCIIYEACLTASGVGQLHDEDDESIQVKRDDMNEISSHFSPFHTIAADNRKFLGDSNTFIFFYGVFSLFATLSNTGSEEWLELKMELLCCLQIFIEESWVEWNAWTQYISSAERNYGKAMQQRRTRKNLRQIQNIFHVRVRRKHEHSSDVEWNLFWTRKVLRI